jgi:hypothetical protein
MRYLQVDMRATSYFQRLQKVLLSPGIPSQTEVAEALRTDQPFVSNAMTGRLKRITPRVIALRRYAFRRVRAYARNPPSPIEGASGTVARVRQAAMEACHDYLEAGFDPRVLRDQVTLLRRAQSVGGDARP